jgi:hypothetical protein
LDIADTEVVAGATYTGGGVISQPTFRFGYFQVRAWTPPSVTGWLTTFSLNGGANAIESWNRRALPAKFTEIDGFNIDSSNPTQMSSGVTSWTGSTATPALCSGGYTNIYNSSPTTPPGPPIDSSANGQKGTSPIMWMTIRSAHRPITPRRVPLHLSTCC